MRTRHFLILAAVLAAICFIFISLVGNTCTISFPLYSETGSAEDYEVIIESGGAVAEITGKRIENSALEIDLKSLSPGKAYVSASGPDDYSFLNVIYVHKTGVITVNSILGFCRGGISVPIASSLFIAVLLIDRIRRLRRSMSEDLYRYANIKDLGLVIYLAAFLLLQSRHIFGFEGLIDSASSVMSTASSFAVLSFPLAFIVSLMVSFSNLRLMQKEGRNFRNMLGFILGLLLCLGIIFPVVLGEYLQRASFVDVHDQGGTAMYIEMLIEDMIHAVVVYLECMLIGTIVMALRAARGVPDFDRDYIIILGCMVTKDGSLTKLLKGRVDRALEFARMQKERSGKDIIFVPSGGKGADEPCSEAEAMKNYLLSQGIEEDRIIAEDKSEDTFENMRNSKALIAEHSGAAKPKLAFSTTNYHVFRSGVISSGLDMGAQGIGSPTRSYFWINAFIREFIALMYSERKTHIRVIAVLALIVMTVVFMIYKANTV
ncbi:MAG: YdcF family protein [Synergistes sp.]|nr:YdcF family protein [Synergistes sp.]